MYFGLILHLVSRITFVLGSYAMHFFLGKYLPEAEYGMVGTVITVMNFEYIFFTDGVRQGMSKTISSGKYEKTSLIRTGAIFQGGLIVFFFCLTYLGAGALSAALKDDSLAPYIRNLAWLLPFTGLYSLTLGILNGHKSFLAEAGSGIIYPLLKLSVIPSVLFVFSDAVLGVQAGFMFAAVVISLLTLGWTISILKKDRAVTFPQGTVSSTISMKEYAGLAGSYLLLFGASTFMMNLDTLILKRVGGSGDIVGYYTGVVNLAKIPYYLLTACYTVALPLISEYYSSGQLKAAADRIRSILALIVAFILPVVLVVAAASGHILSIFYRPAYRLGENALTLLITGVACLGMMLFFSTILSSADRRVYMVCVSAAALLAQALLCYKLTGLYSLTGTALATLLAAGAGMLACALPVKKIFGNYWSGRLSAALACELVLFALYLLFFRLVYRSESFFILVLTCGACFMMAVAAGFLILRPLIINKNDKGYAAR